MQRAIRVNNDGGSVIVTFEKNTQTQLTSSGQQEVKTIKAVIFNADGLGLLAAGFAIKQPEDAENDQVGSELALRRALRSSPLSAGERSLVFQAFQRVVNAPAPASRCGSDIYKDNAQQLRTRESIERLRNDLIQRLPRHIPQPAPFSGYGSFVNPSQRASDLLDRGYDRGYGFGV